MRKLKLDELNRLTVEGFKSSEKISVQILLDNVRSLHNVGSAFRTGDAFAIEKILLTGITGKPPHREIHKTALGATDSVDWQYLEKPVEYLKNLKNEGYTILAAEQTDSSIILTSYQIDPQGKYLIIFGNEVDGVSNSLLEYVDESIEIEQYGTKHSFNISVSLGIVLYVFSNEFRHTNS